MQGLNSFRHKWYFWYMINYKGVRAQNMNFQNRKINDASIRNLDLKMHPIPISAWIKLVIVNCRILEIYPSDLKFGNTYVYQGIVWIRGICEWENVNRNIQSNQLSVFQLVLLRNSENITYGAYTLNRCVKTNKKVKLFKPEHSILLWGIGHPH